LVSTTELKLILDSTVQYVDEYFSQTSAASTATVKCYLTV